MKCFLCPNEVVLTHICDKCERKNQQDVLLEATEWSMMMAVWIKKGVYQ